MTPLDELLARFDAVAAAGGPRATEGLVRSLAARSSLAGQVGDALRALADGRVDEAVTGLRAAARVAGDDPRVLALLGRALAAAGDPDGALAAAEHAAALDVAPDALVALGALLLDLGRPREAEAAFRQALDVDEGHADAHLGLARARRVAPDQATALSHLAKAAAQAPTSAVLDEAASMYAASGWPIGAAAAGDMMGAAVDDPDDRAWLRLALFELALDAERYLEGASLMLGADERLAQVGEAGARASASWRLRLALRLFARGRVEAAVALFDTARDAAVAPDDVARRVYFEGLAREHAGDRDSALVWYEAAVATNPRRWDACCDAVHLLLERGGDDDVARARALIERVPVELRAARPALRLNEALVARRLGDHARAEILLGGLAATLPPDHPVAARVAELSS